MVRLCGKLVEEGDNLALAAERRGHSILPNAIGQEVTLFNGIVRIARRRRIISLVLVNVVHTEAVVEEAAEEHHAAIGFCAED